MYLQFWSAIIFFLILLEGSSAQDPCDTPSFKVAQLFLLLYESMYKIGI